MSNTLSNIHTASADDGTPTNAIANITAKRSDKNPLITFDSSDTLGHNINGPSVIRVPEWINEPLGKYYMYFSHHADKHIRLAYADSPEGPWKIYEPGSLHLHQAKAFDGHIASPDVLIDHERKQIRMYFHGEIKEKTGQWTGVALSNDGLNFQAREDVLGKFYFRVFEHNGYYYAIAKDDNNGWGKLYRSKDGLTPFEEGDQFVQMMRHCAVMKNDDNLLVFYSRKGDAPERIMVLTVNLTDDWTNWQESQPIEVLRPEADYEGIEYENKPSEYSAAIEVNQLRDPCIFQEDGVIYLYYAYAGEMGIAMATLDIRMCVFPSS